MAETNLVQITLRGKDELTGVLKQVQQALDALGKQQQQSSKEMTQAITQQTQAWQRFGSILGGLGIATGIAAITAQVVSLGKSIVQTGVQMEGLRASLAATSGGAQQAAQTMQFLINTSNRLGVDLVTAANAFKSLQAATRGTVLEGQQTQQIFTAVSQAIRVTGGSSEQLGRALLAIQQIISKGTVQAEELRGQLGEALPGAFQIAARAMGVTTAELGKMLETGKLVSTEFIGPFIQQLKQEFGPGVDTATKTAGHAFANLANEIVLAKNAIAGSGLLAILRDMAQASANFLRTQREIREEREQMAGGPAPDLPKELEGTAIGARAKEIERLRGFVTGRRGLIENMLYPTREEAAEKLKGLLDDQRKAIKTHQDQLLAEQDPDTGAGVVLGNLDKLRAQEAAVLKLFETGRKALRDIDRDMERGLADPAKVAEEKLRVWEKTVNDVRALMSKMAQPLRAEFGPQFAEEVKRSNMIKATLEAEINLERETEDRRQKIMEIGREDLQLIEERNRKQAETLATLQRMVAAYEQTKTARDADTASALAAQFPQNALIQQTAKQVIELAELKDAYEEAKDRVQEFARSGDLLGLSLTPEVEKARNEQEAFNKKLADTMRLLETPRAERTSERLRQEAPGGMLTPQQDLEIAMINAREKALVQQKEMADIARDLARNIEGTFQDMWDAVFVDGVKGFKDMGVIVLGGLQRLFSQLSSQLLSQLLGKAIGGTGGDSGLGGALASVLIKLGGSLFGSSAGASLDATPSPKLFAMGGITPALQSIRDAGFRQRAAFRGFQPLSFFANGTPIVDRPTLAMVGEGHFKEAVVPLPDGRSIPVDMRGGGGMGGSQPIVIQLHQDFSGALDPRALFPSRAEIIPIVVGDVQSDGPMRRVIVQQR